jgi:hypothetical protein
MRLVQIGSEAIELPPELADVVDTMAAQIDRRDGAALVTRYLFPTTKQTVKSWPLNWSCPNGKALASPAEYLGFALMKARNASHGNSRWFRAAAPQTADAA